MVGSIRILLPMRSLGAMTFGSVILSNVSNYHTMWQSIQVGIGSLDWPFAGQRGTCLSFLFKTSFFYEHKSSCITNNVLAS